MDREDGIGAHPKRNGAAFKCKTWWPEGLRPKSRENRSDPHLEMVCISIQIGYYPELIRTLLWLFVQQGPCVNLSVSKYSSRKGSAISRAARASNDHLPRLVWQIEPDGEPIWSLTITTAHLAKEGLKCRTEFCPIEHLPYNDRWVLGGR